jgi:hypothetical protein
MQTISMRSGLLVMITLGVGCRDQRENRELTTDGEGFGVPASLCTIREESRSERHFQDLRQMIAADRATRRSNFGLANADTSDVRIVVDYSRCRKAEDALDSVYSTFRHRESLPSRIRNEFNLQQAPPKNVFLYLVGSSYVVVDGNQKLTEEATLAPTYYFFDSAWRYLGSR